MKLVLGWLLMMGGLTPLALAVQAPPTEPPQADEARQALFEVATIGSGAPEVFVWFGPDETALIEPGELSARRALVEALRAAAQPGRGRFHVLVAPGPRDPELVAFQHDFPDMRLDGEPKRAELARDAFQRQDTRAIASYLVRHANTGGGLAAILRANAPEAQSLPAPQGSLERFAHVGLGLGTRGWTWQPDDLDAVVTELTKLRNTARLTWRVLPNGIEHLGGDLYQVDLELGAPALAPAVVDPRRTYPRPNFRLTLTSTYAVRPPEAPVIEGTGEDATVAPKRVPAALVELAARASTEATAPFERIARTGERFRLAPFAARSTVRVVLRFPEGVESVALELDGARMGTAQVSIGNVRPKQVEPSEPVDVPPPADSAD